VKNNIFETKVEMPSPHNEDNEVVRTALTMRDAQMHNFVPALRPSDNGTKSVQRPRRGHGY